VGGALVVTLVADGEVDGVGVGVGVIEVAASGVGWTGTVGCPGLAGRPARALNPQFVIPLPLPHEQVS
jgi:hypothetical protein